MRDISVTPKFKKQMRKVSSYKEFKKNRFDAAVSMLQKGETLPENYRDHKAKPTSPDWLRGKRICHVSPNICLIYELTKDTVELNYIGSHSDLQLTEATIS